MDKPISSKLEVFQVAMPMCGANVPASLDDQTAEAIAANAYYELMVKDELESFAWSFSTKEGDLTYQGETGNYPAYAWTIPSEVMTPRAVMYGGKRFRDFEMRGEKLLCNLSSEATGFTMIYTWRAPEYLWTAKFAMGIAMKLAAHLCNGLLDRPEQGASWDSMAERKIREAKRANRNTFQGPEVSPDPVLISAWKGTKGQRSMQGLAAINSGT
jgi:hypothetical protein